jgi:large subunit ribosomal protein L17
MRHRVYGKHLSRDDDHRRAMIRNLAAGLFEHGKIETTLPKAKAVQPFVEKIITIAKKGTYRARRRIEAKLNDRAIHAWVADPNVPDARKDNPYFDLPDQSDIEFNRYGEVRKAPRLVQHILTKVAPLFADRDGGYTRIVKLATHRLGDGADLVLLQLVGREEGPQIGGGRSRRREQADRRTAYYAKLRKGGGGGADSTEADTVTDAATDESEPATATVVAVPESDDSPAPEDEAPADQSDEEKKS